MRGYAAECYPFEPPPPHVITCQCAVVRYIKPHFVLQEDIGMAFGAHGGLHRAYDCLGRQL